MLRHSKLAEDLFVRHVPLRFAALIAVLLIVSFVSIFIGPVSMSVNSVLSVLRYQFFGTFFHLQAPRQNVYVIVSAIREPEIVAALVVGAMLGIGGTVIQSIFRNPITEPYIIGVSSGAALGAVISIGYGLTVFGFYSTQIFAFLFSLAVVSIVYFISMRRGRLPVTYFLLIGISVSFFISAIVAYVIITDTKLAGENEILSWLLGSLQSITWNQLAFVTAIVVLTSIGSMSLSKGLDTVQMGEEYAASVGVKVERVKKLGIVSVTLGISAAVSISGLIGFVGLIMPHLSRLLFGGSNRVVIPTSAVLGATFLLLADDISRLSSVVIPVGIVTAIVGAPVFIYLLWRLAFGPYEN